MVAKFVLSVSASYTSITSFDIDIDRPNVESAEYHSMKIIKTLCKAGYDRFLLYEMPPVGQDEAARLVQSFSVEFPDPIITRKR